MRLTTRLYGTASTISLTNPACPHHFTVHSNLHHNTAIGHCKVLVNIESKVVLHLGKVPMVVLIKK